MLVDARGGVGATAESCGDFAALEVAEELLPFLVGRDAVFLGRAQVSATGEEREVGLDGLVRVDGLVAEGDVDGLVAAMTCAMCGGRPLRMASVMKSLRKSWGV